MKYYLILTFAVILGQLFAAAIYIYLWQAKNDMIGYSKASELYVKKNIPAYVIILLFTILIMFVMSDYMDMNLSRAELIAKGRLTRFENIQANFRLYSIAYGVFAEVLIAMLYKKAKNEITNYAGKQGFDLTETNKS